MKKQCAICAIIEDLKSAAENEYESSSLPQLKRDQLQSWNELHNDSEAITLQSLEILLTKHEQLRFLC
jgi:hypothetical protein